MSEIAIRSSTLIAAMAALVASASLIMGIYVYRDAKKRNMPAFRWALIAAFFPALTGFAVYLLTRCPRIEPVKGSKRDRSLVFVIAALVMIPFLLLFLSGELVLQRDSGLRVKQYGAGGALTLDEYCKQVDGATAAKVCAWFDSLPTVEDTPYPPVCMLRYDASYRGEPRQYYLAALPHTGRAPVLSIDKADGLFYSGIKLEVIATPNGGSEYTLASFAVSGGTPDRMMAKIVWTEHETEVTQVDYNPTTLNIIPDYSSADPSDQSLNLPKRIRVAKCSSEGHIGSSQHSFESETLIEGRTEIFELLKALYSAEYMDFSEAEGQTYSDLFIIHAEYDSRGENPVPLETSEFWVTIGKESGECIVQLDDFYGADRHRRADRSLYDGLQALFDD